MSLLLLLLTIPTSPDIKTGSKGKKPPIIKPPKRGGPNQNKNPKWRYKYDIFD